jgi:hypothetical protein
MNITGAEFAAPVEDWVESLDKFQVPEREKAELLSALAAMKPTSSVADRQPLRWWCDRRRSPYGEASLRRRAVCSAWRSCG